jgi:subtilisin-like proprotein convertase family protein
LAERGLIKVKKNLVKIKIIIKMKILTKLFVTILLLASVQTLYSQMFWNHAAKFDGGTNSYIACASTLPVSIVGSVTMEAWVYPTTSTGTRYIIFKGNASSGYYLRINTSGTVSMGTNGINRVTSTGTVPSGQWTHIAGTYNVNTDAFTVYINGQDDGTIVNNSAPTQNTDSLYIGKFGSSSFTGLMDEIRIWTKEVSQNDIRRNMRASLTLSNGAYTSLLFSMPFQRINSTGTVFTLSDLSLNPIGITPGFNRGVTGVNLGNAPSDYLNTNSALVFEGNNDSYMELANNSLTNFTGSTTLEAWVYQSGVSAVNKYIFHKYSAGNGIRLMVNGSNKLAYTVNSSLFYQSSATLETNRWYHVAWVISASGSSSLYVNGKLDSYLSGTGVPNTTPEPMYVGRGFNGLIDEVRVFKFERTEAEINRFATIPMDASNVPAGDGFVFNLDGSGWSNAGAQILKLAGNTFFTAAGSIGGFSAPLVRTDNNSFEQGFYKKINYKRIPFGSSIGDMQDDTITISDNTTINDVNVYVGLQHSRVDELEVYLVAPNGTEVMLMNNLTLKSANVSTVFDDQADSSLADNKYVQLSPKVKPENSLNSTFQGMSSQGQWRLKVKDVTGVNGGSLTSWGIQINNSQVIGIQNISNEVPAKFTLGQNYPNPFNPVTNIEFSISKAANTKMTVYDITGKEVAVLVNKQLTAGTYKVDFDASHLATGTYFYRLESGDFTEVKKMLLVK